LHFFKKLFIEGSPIFPTSPIPRIPAALAPAVVGIVSLHDSMPQPLSIPAPEFTVAGGSIGENLPEN